MWIVTKVPYSVASKNYKKNLIELSRCSQRPDRLAMSSHSVSDGGDVSDEVRSNQITVTPQSQCMFAIRCLNCACAK